MGLHAKSLEFKHPVTRSQVSLEAPYPIDFERTLGILRQTPTDFVVELLGSSR
jgi:hypothetical protein